MASVRESLRQQLRRLQKIQQRNIQIFRHQPLQEISGSFGDLGTLLPIIIALSAPYNLDGGGRGSGISLPSTLVFSGLANILTGLFFGIPLPVQPMKAIAAVAIAQHFSKAELASAGLFVAGVIGFLSITGLLDWFTRKIPIPVIKGIQVGTGLSLMISAGVLAPLDDLLVRLHSDDLTGPLLAIVLLVYCQIRPRVPYALIILLFCLVLVLPDTFSHGRNGGFGFWNPRPFVPSVVEFRTGAIEAGLGQLPLTTLNSIVAVTYLSADLFPDVQAPSATSLGLSVAAMNLIGCWFGAMPVCHGSGGLAAQYRFGARSGASIIFLGLIKLILGLFAGKQTLAFFKDFPKFQLAILVFIAGLELVKVGESLNNEGARDLWETIESDTDGTENKRMKILTEEDRKRRWIVMFVTIGGILAFRNDAMGFVGGMLLNLNYAWLDRLEGRRREREGQIRLENDRPDDETEAQPLT
ncbi:hypothetical protein MMC24_005002 [Lignoscripta atroalba]|nr:hypothetical protein [Lignoscripta atroalba]